MVCCDIWLICSYVHVLQRMKPKDFVDPLTFSLRGTTRLIVVVLGQISQQLHIGLPWHLVYMFICSPEDESSWPCWLEFPQAHHEVNGCGFNLNISTANYWVAMFVLFIPSHVHVPQRMNPEDFFDPLTFLKSHCEVNSCGFNLNITKIYLMVCHDIWCIHSYVHVLQRMNPNNFVDPLTFSLRGPQG